MSQTRILITGGAGFIGTAMRSEFARHGYDVYVLDNFSVGKREHLRLPESRIAEGDIRDRAFLDATFAAIQPQHLLHLAAIHFIPYCNERPFEASDINIRGTMQVLDAARSVEGLKSVIFASTAAVYPIYDGALSEAHAPGPVDIYGLSKLTGERLCHEFHLSSGIPALVCRFFNAFGPYETNPHLIPAIHQQLVEKGPKIKLGNLDTLRDFIHVSDMARAVRMLFEKFDAGFDIFNLGSGIEYSGKEVVEAFERSIGQPVEIEQDPLRMRPSDRKHLRADITKLTRYIDWKPEVSFQAGIDELYQTGIL
jgi:UDP-glucose 4-epimerase